MSYEPGDVVVAVDPFRDGDGAVRPFLVINQSTMPFHANQSIALALTTRSWYDNRIPVPEDAWVVGGAPKSSSIVPWSVHTVQDAWISFYQGTLHDDVVSQAIERLIGYFAV